MKEKRSETHRVEPDWFPPPSSRIIYKIGIYGWRKRCLYCCLLFLFIIIILNIVITIWIVRVLKFSAQGIGNIQLKANKTIIKGDAYFQKDIYASKLVSAKKSPMMIQSGDNITLVSFRARQISSLLHLGSDGLSARCNIFRIVHNSGKELFYADAEGIRFGSPNVLQRLPESFPQKAVNQNSSPQPYPVTCLPTSSTSGLAATASGPSASGSSSSNGGDAVTPALTSANERQFPQPQQQQQQTLRIRSLLTSLVSSKDNLNFISPSGRLQLKASNGDIKVLSDSGNIRLEAGAASAASTSALGSDGAIILKSYNSRISLNAQSIVMKLPLKKSSPSSGVGGPSSDDDGPAALHVCLTSSNVLYATSSSIACSKAPKVT